MIQDFEKNWRWGKLTVYEGESDGSDGTPVGSTRFTWHGFSFRIGWHQVALWYNFKPVINWLTPWSDRRYSFLKGLYIGYHPIFTYGK